MRRVAAVTLGAAALLGALSTPANADNGPLVKSHVNTGVSVGGLLDVGSSSRVNGTNANTGVQLNAPAGANTSVNSNTYVGVDVLTDLVASVSGVVKL